MRENRFRDEIRGVKVTIKGVAAKIKPNIVR
jgi:hypothetical protein